MPWPTRPGGLLAQVRWEESTTPETFRGWDRGWGTVAMVGPGGTGVCPDMLIWLWKPVLFTNHSQRAEEPQNLPSTTVRFLQFLTVSKQ